MKVYELAKDLNLKSVDLLDKLRKEHNMSLKSHMQVLSSKDVEKIKYIFKTKKKVLVSSVSKKKTIKKKKSSPSKPDGALLSEVPLSLVAPPPVLRTGVIRRRGVEQGQKVKKPPTDVGKSMKKKPVEAKTKETVQSSSMRATPPVRPGLISTSAQNNLLKEGSSLSEVFPADKKKAKKTTLEKEGQNQQFRATDFRKREVIFQPKKKHKVSGKLFKKPRITTPKLHKRIIKIYDNSISLEGIAHAMGVKKKLLMQKIKSEGLFSDSKIPTAFDYETAEVISSFFNFEVKDMTKGKDKVIESLFFGKLSAKRQTKPPVVTVMGHVNHGKTTLLDYIRKSRVASQEEGGITQHIGAYSVPVGKSFVTFIDTPGHSAFTAMRARGAQVTDIVVLVVAGDDGLQPQTIEAIDHAKNAKVPIVVAINKMDLPHANIDNVKKQLMEKELVPEEWGGETIFCPISALKGDGVKELLEHITLLAEVHELKANPNRSALGVIIESRLDKGRGWVMTLLVQDGSLESGQVLIADDQVGRARQMTNDMGQRISVAGPGVPVEISGFNQPVQAGEPFYAVKSEKEARRFISERKNVDENNVEEEIKKLSVDELLSKAYGNTKKTLNLILKTDVVGSQEAIKYSIEQLNTEEVAVKIIHAGPGFVNESDVLLARSSGAILICFNVSISDKARKAIQQEGVIVKSYKVIYDLLKEMETMMAGLLDPEIQETFGGRAEVRQVFSISNVGTIAGCKVLKGKIASTHKARLVRDDNVIYEGKISSLKRFKQSAKEVLEGQECGISLDQNKDFKPGDTIESFIQTEIKKEKLS